MNTPKNTPKKEIAPEGQQPPLEVPLAPFTLLSTFELALLAALLSKGKDPAKHLPAAASLWAEAFQYMEELSDTFWGEGRPKMPGLNVISLGAKDQWVDVKDACAKYSWGQRHLRNILKQLLPPHIFQQLWKKQNTLLPITLLEQLDKLQARKRSARSQKLPVKPVGGI